VSKSTDASGLGSLGSGAVTAAALAVQTGLAAVVGFVLAREFGRGPETDGFFAAYGVFAVLVLAATAIRLTVLPALTRAQAARRLGGETTAYALTLAIVAVPALLAALVAAGPIGGVLTGHDSGLARETAANALPWMVLAAVCQLYAGLAASTLAALDDYGSAAFGFALGSVAGLAFILLRVDPDGIEALSWGMAVNGAIALVVPAVALVRRARRAAMPRTAARPAGASARARLAELGRGVALPLALQAIYLVSIPFSAREGVGAVTSFGYAYLVASALVAVTASSLGLVTAVPLTRAGLDPPRVARHVVAASWLSLAVIGGAAGVFALAGEPIIGGLLGPGYTADVGDELGRLIVLFAVWAVVAVGATVTFPLLFVAGSGTGLPLLAVALVLVHVPIAWLGQSVGGLDGLALSLALTTALLLGAMLVRLEALAATARGLGVAAAVVGVLVVAAFAPPGLLLGPLAAAAGLALYAALLAAFRPAGLVSAWRYLRALS
jgi:hypothetical protein